MIGALFYREGLALLDNDEHVKLFGFGNFDIIDSIKNAGSNPITQAPNSAQSEVNYCLDQESQAHIEAFARPSP